MEIQRIAHGRWETEYFLTDVESFVGPRELGEALLQDWPAQAGRQDRQVFRAIVRAGGSLAETVVVGATAVATAATVVEGDGRPVPG
ncbi:hypothetical protein ACFXPI_27145 [Streptomyces sp. NPDC059104]|uniref:hypothetical protein n=1 Tax=Streptomyces sp. NPDC059104 TaxID=3346729 RepID=UPI0036987CAB